MSSGHSGRWKCLYNSTIISLFLSASRCERTCVVLGQWGLLDLQSVDSLRRSKVKRPWTLLRYWRKRAANPGFSIVCTQESGARLAASYLVTRETLEKPSVEQVHADMTYLK